MIVIVQETIEYSGEVTYASLRSYLVWRGWVAEHYPNAVTNGAPNPFDAWRFPGDKILEGHRKDHPRVVCIGERDFTDLGGLTAVVNRIERIALLEGRKPHEVIADIADGGVGDAGAPRGLGATPLTDTVDELLALRKQAVLDRQSREASQVEFARLNRELNEAKATARKYESLRDGTLELLGEARWRVGNLLDEIASTAIAAGMIDPARRGSLDGPNAIQFLRLMTEQYEAMK